LPLHLYSVFLLFAHYPAPSQVSPLSLHDALPICGDDDPRLRAEAQAQAHHVPAWRELAAAGELFPPHQVMLRTTQALDVLRRVRDRKSTRLNSSHGSISYAVFCLKQKKNIAKTLP